MDDPDAQLVERATQLGREGPTGELLLERERLVRAAHEDAVAIEVEGVGQPSALHDAPHQLEIARRVLLLPEERARHRAGGIVDGPDQRRQRPLRAEPAVAAAVGLEQHPLPGHPLPAAAMLRGTPRPGAADPRREQDAPDGGAVQMDALALREQVREVRMVGVRVPVAHEIDDTLGEILGQGMPGTSAPVAMDQRGRPVTTVSGQDPEHLALGDTEQGRHLRHGEVTGQMGVDDAGTALLPGPEVDRGFVHDSTG